MSRSAMPTRRTTLTAADDDRRDREFWRSVPPVERFLWVFQMSEEAYALAGKLPDDPAGRPRSTARVLRP
ncbi:MAG TPA: hypothetical protein VI942_12010 [Thermoanaerobaculia bacterium]|nr:hypothetical protein [Thermoanaerobaculia bacterium]